MIVASEIGTDIPIFTKSSMTHVQDISRTTIHVSRKVSSREVYSHCSTLSMNCGNTNQIR